MLPAFWIIAARSGILAASRKQRLRKFRPMAIDPDPYQIDVASCRSRQKRLLAEMQRLELDLCVVTLIENVQLLAGPRFRWYFAPCAALSADGRLTLVAPERQQPEVAAADEVATYEAQWLSTLRNDQRQASAAALWRALSGAAQWKRVGVEFSVCGPDVTGQITDCPLTPTLSRKGRGGKAELVNIEPELYRLRRRKDPDELSRIKKAIAGTRAMYDRARQIVAPGLSELEMFNQLQAAAVEEFGEMLTATGNDYAVAARGGPPGRARATAGDLWILDLGPAFRGYFADNCRTLAVGGQPSDAQRRAWECIVPVFDHVEATMKPGKSCRALFEEAKAMLDEAQPWAFNHHLGHGIGLFPHEAPHLNPNWDDTFEIGDVIAVEPGLYAPELRMGIRLENNYVVTEAGVELLSDFPLEL